MVKIKNSVNEIKKMGTFLLKAIRLLWDSSKISFIVTLIITIINGVIIPLNLVISKYLIDSVVAALANANNHKYYNVVFLWLGIEFAITVFSQLIQRVNTYYSVIQVRTLNNHICKLIVKKSNELDLSFFENNDFYNKIEKANDQAAYSAMAIINALMEVIKNFTILVGSIAIVIQLSPFMLLLCLLTSIPMFILNLKISEFKYSVYSKRIEKTRFAQHLQKLMLHYNSVKEIKLSRLGKYFENLILSIYKENLDKDKSVEKKRFGRLSLADCLSVIITYCYKFYIVILTISKGLTIGSMNMYVTAITNVDNSIKSTLNNMAELYSNNLYIENLFYVLDLKPIIVAKEVPKILKNSITDCIEFRNVSFKYPESNKYVLKNVSFKIKANQNCALVGLNGCGKTTLIKLLARLYEPTEGGIFIDGININEFSLELLYKCINVVFQDFMKYPFTVKENIGFGNIENLGDMDRIELSAKKANAYEFIQSLKNKFDTKLEKLWSNGVELSLGQWQKLAISRAFMSNSSILILDEPTASVDAETEYELFKNFKELVGNRTSILISHRFSTVRMADLIIVLNEGTVIEKGTHNSLMLKEGLYSKLYNMQAEGYLDNSVDVVS
ncbi:ABC transporter ATP-binding protein [Clostridium pasteurianum]|uniref:ABC-type multidrug transport system, ATPase and permease component n=1 Tax=Clostridium pasteurianum BC1 TaxID=86416 RepID=R4JYZ0_CLOPA|nr:ABC transporter ATP-binding protein [Clostridium pasteurianum]AGK96022.1 ABC-type multidrug transport system, ATPase and permease component [Clostridium pasteurianum BC1]